MDAVRKSPNSLNPSPNAASVALIRGDTALLIQRARAPFAGLWTLPGGRLERGEDAKAAAAREVREELGMFVRALQPVATLGVARGFVLQVFATRHFHGEIALSDEVSDVLWATAEEAASLQHTPGLLDILRQAFALPASAG